MSTGGRAELPKANSIPMPKTIRPETKKHNVIFTFEYGRPFTLQSLTEREVKDIMADMTDKNCSSIMYTFEDGDQVCLLKDQIIMAQVIQVKW